jgi:uncharacterized membrane protein
LFAVNIAGALIVSIGAGALFGSLQSQWLVRKAHVSLNFLSLIGFVIAGGLLLYESLLMGPPGTLTIFDLNQMLLPAAVSLLWAGIGALLSWLSMRKQSRTLWSLGAFLLAAAAVKLILFDFGSPGQIGNILATMAVGGVFLLVAWVAPFPPRASASIHHGPEAPQRNVSTHE